MTSWRSRVQGFVGLGVLLVGILASAHPLQAFNKTWFSNGCTNATGDLWDDMPGAGLNNEAGLFWVDTNSLLNEECTFSADGEGVSTDTYRYLKMRVSVNDGAIFTVRLREVGEFCTGTVIATLATSTSQDNSGWVSKQLTLPLGKTVGDVCITLTDDPNGVLSQRAAALIDYIKITGAAGIGWQETFSRAN